MKIGIIGARSKHLRFFSEAIRNISPANADICNVWGQDAPAALPALKDMNIYDTQEALIAASDAVIIALREGTQHAYPALECLRLGKPVFVDKPFTCSPEEAEEIAECASNTGTPCTGGSTLCFIPAVRSLAGHLPVCRSYTLSFTADPFDPFGGWYFYGSHLTDLCTAVFGCDFLDVEAELRGAELTARVFYPDYTVTLHSAPQPQKLLLTADRTYVLDDAAGYRCGMAHFLKVICGKENGEAQRLAASVRLIDRILCTLRLPISGEAQPYRALQGAASDLLK